ncbi:MAG TPA: hypothetical protein VE890_03075, partial [Thermoguttaceae bacterium]|nr:hypothetical protein [Thermoguttaceae bacterium]
KAAVDLGMPLDCAWLPKGAKKAFVACSDGTIKIFTDNSQQLTHTATLRGHTDWIYAVALSPDATRLASAAGDGTVKIWSTADEAEKLLATLVQLAPKSDEWLIVAADGWYATSTPEAVNWTTTNLEVAPEKLATLQTPQAVAQTLSGEPPAAPSLP